MAEGAAAEESRATWALYGAVAVAFLASVWAIDRYGGLSFWPGLVGNFGASLAAFVLALSWQRTRERQQALADAADAAAERERQEADLHQRRSTEVRRRLTTVREELEKDLESLEVLKRGFDLERADGQVRVLHPQLLDGAWAASAPRVAQLIADYEFVSAVSTAYGRIEELRWRMRQRTTMLALGGDTAPHWLVPAFDNMTAPLVDELLPEVQGLLKRIQMQIASPDVQPLGLLHVDSATVRVGLEVTGSG